MDTQELLKKVRKIEIKSRGLSRQIFAGEYHSAFKGRGMTFSEVREYGYGDEVRSIDWNVTARFNAPYVKIFEEERELTVMLLVDVSGSSHFGSQQKLKQELITELASVLIFSAGMNNDKVGIILFSDQIELYVPPKKGRSHSLRLIREILNFEPQSKKTNIEVPLKFLTNVVKKRCTAFLLSDMLDVDKMGKPQFEASLKVASSKHDIGVIHIYDNRELELPNVGIVEFEDAESGKLIWIDTAKKDIREAYKTWRVNSDTQLNQIFSKVKVDQVLINTEEDFVRPLIKLFHRR